MLLIGLKGYPRCITQRKHNLPTRISGMPDIWVKPRIMAARSLDIKVYPSANCIWIKNPIGELLRSVAE